MSTSRERRINSFRDSLQELSQLGSPVDLAVATQQLRSRGLEIEQSGESPIFELANGRIGYMLDICLVNQTSRAMYLLDLELLLPWDEKLFDWLQPETRKIKNYKERSSWDCKQYRFPGRAGLDLPFEQVINHELTPNQRLPSYRPISGWLLGIGGLMHPSLFHGGQIAATLVITTSDHAEHPAPILFCVERLERKAQRLEPRPSLFADPIQDPLDPRHNVLAGRRGLTVRNNSRIQLRPNSGGCPGQGCAGGVHDRRYAGSGSPRRDTAFGRAIGENGQPCSGGENLALCSGERFRRGTRSAEITQVELSAGAGKGKE